MAQIQAQAQAQGVYPCAIPSLQTIHPQLAPLAMQFPEISVSEAQGANLRPAAVNDARLVAKVVEAAHQHNPAVVSLDTVNDAYTRRAVIEGIHGADTFMGGLQNAIVLAITPAVNAAVQAALQPANIVGNVANVIAHPAVNNALNGAVTAAVNNTVPNAVNNAVNLVLGPHINTLTLLAAEFHSYLARVHNRLAERSDPSFQIQGIKKTVAGSGLPLAMGVMPQNQAVAAPPATQNQLNTVCQLLMAATPQTIFGLSHADILVLIEFYNESMGIVAGDGIGDRRVKVYNWIRN
ncbi:hypothetical protein C8R43DRAFT_963565 [Mycena crocata]|nr:hypothetical protein C8R43DRAFT_963565 [Mycena crocata]